MPDLKKTVEILFQGVDNVSSGVDSVFGNLGRLERGISAVADPIANGTKAILKFEAAMAVTGAAVTAYSVKLASDFDTAFREIATLVDAPADNLAEFRQSILDYASDSTQSLEQITNATYSAISAGVDYRDSLSVVSEAERLAVAGKADLSETLVVLVSSLNAYGDASSEAGRYADALFTAVKQGQTTLPELAQSLSQVTGIAASAGVDFNELLAAVATLTAAGQPTSQAVTAIRGAISSILKPTKEAQELAASLGIKFNAAALESKGFSGVLADVQKATKGNTEQMAILFGSVEGLNGALTLTGKGAASFRNNLDEMGNSTGAARTAFDKMADSADNLGQKVKNAFEGFLIGIGDQIVDEFGGAQAALAGIFDTLGDAVRSEDGPLAGVGEAIEAVAQDLTAALQRVAENLPAALASADYSEFRRGLETLRDGVADLFKGVDITSMEGLRRVIEGVGSAFNTLAQFTVGVGVALAPVVEAVADAVTWFAGLDDEGKKVLGVIGGVAVAFQALAPLVVAAAAAVVALNSAFGKTATLLSAKGALVTGVGLAAYEFGKWIDLNDRLVPGTATLGTKLYDLKEAIDKLLNPTNEWVEAQELAHAAMSRQIRESQNLRSEIDQMLDSMKPAIATAEERAEWSGKLAESFKKEGYEYDQATGQIRKLADVQKDAIEYTRGHVQVLRDSAGNIVGYTDGIKGISTSYGDAGKKIEEATKKSDDFLTKMESIASNERIKTLDITARVRVANLEEETKRIQAVLQATSNTVTSTGQVLSSGANALAQLAKDDPWGSSKAFREVQKQVEKENKLRGDAAQLQQKLGEAQLNILQQRANALRRGDPLISITADGLEPELEAFMWQILKRIRVRATESEAEFLLGIS